MSIFRSRLSNAAKTVALLSKISALHAGKPNRVVFEVDGIRFSASEATNVAFDPSAADDQIVFRRPAGVADEYYDLGDIQVIKRLRTKKYLIRIKAGADSAQATV